MDETVRCYDEESPWDMDLIVKKCKANETSLKILHALVSRLYKERNGNEIGKPENEPVHRQDLFPLHNYITVLETKILILERNQRLLRYASNLLIATILAVLLLRWFMS